VANQVQNRLIKQLGEMIGMHQQKVKTKFVGNRQYQTLKSKFEMLTTHTACRTFITLALEKGMRPEIVMRITGQQSSNLRKLYFLRYYYLCCPFHKNLITPLTQLNRVTFS